MTLLYLKPASPFPTALKSTPRNFPWLRIYYLFACALAFLLLEQNY